MSEEILAKRKEKIIDWFKQKDNLILVGILLFALIIRIYYFILTKNQPIWWDESDYLAYAKTLANIGAVDWIATNQHNSLLSFFIACLFYLNFSEPIVRLFVGVIPSLGIIILSYLICREIYSDKRIAYISLFVMTIFWELLFYSMRFHTELWGIFFAFMGIYIFFRGYENKKKIFGLGSFWAIPLTSLFILLSYGFRRQYIFFGLFILIYMLFTKKIKSLFNDKSIYFGIFIAILLFILFDHFIFTDSIVSVADTYYHPENSINWLHLFSFWLFFSGDEFFSNIFLWIFFGGVVFVSSQLVISYDLLKKENKSESRSDLFMVISILVALAYFIFFQRGDTIGECRWYYPFLLPSIILLSRFLVYLTDKIKRYNKFLSIFFLLSVLCIGGYYQFSHADSIIKLKIPSYEGIKQAGLYLGEISNPEEIILSVPVPQPAYYSERWVIHPKKISGVHNDSISFNDFLGYLEKNESYKYLIISFSEPGHPYWMRNEPKEYSYNPNGQVVRTKLEIPFMNTFIDLENNRQQITKNETYGNITFELLTIKEDCFIYEIVHN